MSICRHRDIRYYHNEQCRLDVYVRSDLVSPRAPVVMVIHGGAWVSQSKESAMDMALNLADEGFCVIAPSYTTTVVMASTEPKVLAVPLLVAAIAVLMPREYRLLSGAALIAATILACVSFRVTGPSQGVKHTADIARAIVWAQNNIEFYGGCPEGIVLLGHSAGANIATVVGTNYSYTRRQGIKKDYVRAVVGLSGPYNDIRIREVPLLSPLLYAVFGYRDNYRKFFPMYSADATSPPHLLFSAERDYTLYAHARDYRHRLRSLNVPVDAYLVSGTNHYTIRKYWSGENRRVRIIISNFVRKHLPEARSCNNISSPVTLV